MSEAELEIGRLARIAKETGVQAEPLLDFGVPDECILRRMEQMPVDVLVMGIEGRTGWDRLRLGSTAHTLARRANCPVLAVHGGVAGDVVRHTASVRFARMLLATDFSACAGEALHAVSRLAACECVSCSLPPVGPTTGRSSSMLSLRLDPSAAGSTPQSAMAQSDHKRGDGPCR